VADHAAKDLQDEYNVTYQLPEKSPTGRSTIYVDGPRTFSNMAALSNFLTREKIGDKKAGDSTAKARWNFAAREKSMR
jgi:hypothetical protein